MILQCALPQGLRSRLLAGAAVTAVGLAVGSLTAQAKLPKDPEAHGGMAPAGGLHLLADDGAPNQRVALIDLMRSVERHAGLPGSEFLLPIGEVLLRYGRPGRVLAVCGQETWLYGLECDGVGRSLGLVLIEERLVRVIL